MYMQSILQGIHAQSDIHSRAVREEGSQSRLNKQPKDQDSVPVQQKREFNEKYCEKWRADDKNKFQPKQSELGQASSHSCCLLHALMKERVPPGLADNEISPLDNHNADKEAGVAGEFDDFPLLIGLPGGSTSQPVTCVSFIPKHGTRQPNDHSTLRATLTFLDHQNAAAEVLKPRSTFTDMCLNFNCFMYLNQKNPTRGAQLCHPKCLELKLCDATLEAT